MQASNSSWGPEKEDGFHLHCEQDSGALMKQMQSPDSESGRRCLGDLSEACQ